VPTSVAAPTLPGAPTARRELRALALALDSGRPFIGLRDRGIDPRLFFYVPRELAEREGMMALELVGDVLTVAASTFDPDLGAVNRRFPNVRIDVVMAREDEIMAALARSDRRRA
jgi:type II secretion system (T2SS) protein E